MKKIIALLLIVLMMSVLFAACDTSNENGGSNNANSSVSSTTDSNTGYKAAVALWEIDKSFLSQNGYTVTGYQGTNYANSVVDDIGAPKNSVAAYFNAWENDDGHKMTVYYFINESDAVNCMAGKDSSYKRVGIRVVYNDTKNMIHE